MCCKGRQSAAKRKVRLEPCDTLARCLMLLPACRLGRKRGLQHIKPSRGTPPTFANTLECVFFGNATAPTEELHTCTPRQPCLRSKMGDVAKKQGASHPRGVGGGGRVCNVTLCAHRGFACNMHAENGQRWQCKARCCYDAAGTPVRLETPM